MPDFAQPLLENITGFLMMGVLLLALWVGFDRRSVMRGVVVLIVGVMVVGVFQAFVDDPEGGFAGIFEFIQSDVLGL